MHRKGILARRLAIVAVALAASLSLAQSAFAWDGSAGGRTYGSTALQLDPGTAEVLGSLGVKPGLLAPAYAADDGLNFPITNPLYSALWTRTIKHSGGITLTAGATTVALTNFWIELGGRTLSAEVGGARVPILNLDFSKARVGFSGGSLKIGPVKASLTSQAAGALNAAFGLKGVFKEGIVLGQATVKYRLF